MDRPTNGVLVLQQGHDNPSPASHPQKLQSLANGVKLGAVLVSKGIYDFFPLHHILPYVTYFSKLYIQVRITWRKFLSQNYFVPSGTKCMHLPS